ncbi:hypothetical protein N752_06035 [Desulforamulus aquiferis]|nr:hypothetical protein N752_06035 [Desulforamulus aquiferis]
MLRQEVKKLHSQWQIPFILVTHDEEDANYLGDRLIALDKGQTGQGDRYLVPVQS